MLSIGDNIDKRTFPVVPVILIVLNIVVFLIQNRIWTDAYNPQHHKTELPQEYVDFVMTWGLVPCDVASGQVMGVLTHMFLHGGMLHLIGNMFFLWTFSYSLETGLGRWSLLGFYVLFGVVGGLSHAVFDLTCDLPLVGASGAIAGLMGAYTVLYGLGSKIHAILILFVPVRVSVPAWLFGAGWFAMQFYSAGQDPDGASGVAWYAHIGGFLAGVIVTECCRYDTKADLVRDRQGLLRFEERNTQQGALPEDHAPAKTLPVPETCPHCGSELDEQNRLSECVARCGESECGRFIYLESPDEAAATSR